MKPHFPLASVLLLGSGLPALADALDCGRVHNSQLSMLRNGKLASPGPEVFLALGSINLWLAREAPDGPRSDGPRAPAVHPAACTAARIVSAVSPRWSRSA